MKQFKAIGLFLGCLSLLQGYTQDGIANHGAMQLHGSGTAGFHTDFTNNGPFQSEVGLVGFYREGASLVISGSETPELFDVEFDAASGIWLESPLLIENNANLISGDIRTTRIQAMAYPMFSFTSFFTGDSDVSKVDGFASIRGKAEFTFPIGDATRLRELHILSEAPNPQASAAYYFEAPQASGTLGRSFVSKGETENALRISPREFWRLEGEVPSRVTLTWDVLSGVPGLASFLGDLRVVGWSKAQQTWVDLGNSHVEGGRDYGRLTSDTFVPDLYEIITIGGSDAASSQYQTVDLDNYYLSPNGDGRNETLELAAAVDSPNNAIEIYNRYGQLVYRKEGYTGGFNGEANVDMVVSTGSFLEDGIYFYIITFHDLRQRHQGYFYLNH